MAEMEKAQLRDFVLAYITNTLETMPVLVRNKVCKVFVDIGKYDWPHAFPHFLDVLLQVVEAPKTACIGLYLLQVAFLPSINECHVAQSLNISHFLL